MSTKNKETENKETENTSKVPIQAGALTQLLSQYRTDARLGHEQVSEALCLPVSSVKALENEAFDKLPEPPYIRGYLRTYARLADQDATEAIKIYDQLHGGRASTTATYYHSKGSEEKKPFFSEASVRIGVFLLLLAVLGLLTMQPTIKQWMQDTWDSFSAESDNDKSNKLPGENLNMLTGDIPGNLPMLDKPKTNKIATPEESSNATEDNQTESSTETTETSNKTGKDGDESSEDDSASESTKETDTTASEQQDNSNTEEQKENTTETAETTEDKTNSNTSEEDSKKKTVAKGKVKIKLVFSGEVWLRIQDKDKKIVFEALKPASSEEELILSPPLKLKVGNAGGLKIYVNGKEKDIKEYTKGNIARFTIEE